MSLPKRKCGFIYKIPPPQKIHFVIGKFTTKETTLAGYADLQNIDYQKGTAELSVSIARK